MKKIIIMMGPPGSGKGTQAKKIATKYNYAHISSGDLLRALSLQSELNAVEKEALEQMKAGNLVSDDLIYKLVFDKIESELASGKGVVLDGAIRNLDQVKGFESFFEKKNLVEEVLVIEVVLSDEESFNRLASRRVCDNCGEIIPAKDSALTECPKCSGKLVVRADDNSEIVRQRIEKQGNKAMAPIIDFYKNLGVLVAVDGSASIENVEKNIDNILTA
ncbi:MAG: hypothetical protein A2534_01975 [Candidatus Magasanikbacteria bacterium RIFOXYD2_FULL_39_9]|uniref:Adenylate kinase n=1 Tax=Candidatus Magasanikbacteria bacterium RIFOXYD1_FULL_40_23 TaxID=1798705 RepID=A0A1F6P961_9BACT|nr:MAG: hypothetical protein A2534_01975 [Candidatus Magasanikbacteria bacterium RIFOXYD2_FULL_39_9]OGH92711.1 MAG: hypothetical protein A2563_03500 [Candidatus Magasanikbacteria bacterium RIFOXYD1_FULL_40_23]